MILAFRSGLNCCFDVFIPPLGKNRPRFVCIIGGRSVPPLPVSDSHSLPLFHTSFAMNRFSRFFISSPTKSARQKRLAFDSLELRETPAASLGLFSSQVNYIQTTFNGSSNLIRVQVPAETPSTPPVVVPPPALPTFDLNAASDTGILGDHATSLVSVTLSGTTSPNTTVKLLQTNATVQSDTQGIFSFTAVPLATASTSFTVRATGPTGVSRSSSQTIVKTAAPTILSALAPVSLTAGDSTTLDLADNFDDADITNSLVRLNTSLGPVNIELLDRQAPQTVANFFNYVEDGKYTDAIFHRSAKLSGGTPFVLQGGGFSFETNPSSIAAIPTDPAVQNEPDATNRSNLRGTVAMAKLGGNPNSATNQFFFNLSDNASILDGQNGGFTVFARTASPADQAIVDELAAIPTQNQGSAAALPVAQQGVFGEIPLRNYTGTSFPTDTTATNYALITGATIVRRTEELTWSVTSNTNVAVATPSIADNRLTIQAIAGQTGSAMITVRATDRAGNFVESNVTVNVTSTPPD